MSTDFLVRKTHLSDTQTITTPDAPLTDGQIRVRVDTFALTANNITYAAFGDAMNYWQFFPTTHEGWGSIPVWGFADVVQSLHPGVAVGERLYGYWPMASHAVLCPVRLTDANFMDGAAHRKELHAVYNQYLRVNRDPFYTAATEDLQAVLRPLFITSWLIDDFFSDNGFFGANTLLLSSASSKTAYGTAHQLIARPGIEVVGLTSARNRAFCESLGCYSRVITYDELASIAPDAACAYVDFAGNAALRRDIHTRFANLKYSCSIGGTHVSELGSGKDLPGPRPTLFFAPAQVKKRHADWGPEVFGAALVKAWAGFTAKANNPAAPWLVIEQHTGTAAVQSAYAAILAGQGDPRGAHMLSLSKV